MSYVLYNRKEDKYLEMPNRGMWYSNDYEEAKELLTACHQYVQAVNLSCEDFVIKEISLDQ